MNNRFWSVNKFRSDSKKKLRFPGSILLLLFLLALLSASAREVYASDDSDGDSVDVDITESADADADMTETGAFYSLEGDSLDSPYDQDYGSGSASYGNYPDAPDWYPENPSSFTFYHDENAPRIVDRADIFSEDEEQKMTGRLAELKDQLTGDIVIFTDVSAHGFSHQEYADSFFDFNGYGRGEDYEGICLMICMDPADRGWWVSCHGPVTMSLYTEEVANQIDDLLYMYMKAGNYGGGVRDWIENIRRLYTTGSPYSEEWALQSMESFTRFHDKDAPRIVDEVRLLKEDEVRKLNEKIQTISDKYGLDIVIHTVRHEGILSEDEYGDRFFYFKGYGLGDNYDGIQLTLFKRPDYAGRVRVSASGKGLDKLTEVNKNRLEDRCETLVLNKEYYEAADAWLDQTEHMLRTGRVPKSSVSWKFSTIIELLAGFIFGRMSLSAAKSRMATPKVKENADAYLVRGSLRISRTADTLLNSTVHKAYSPLPKNTERSSGGSSGSHKSSYSHSHTSSSGRTHSGSGRRF